MFCHGKQRMYQLAQVENGEWRFIEPACVEASMSDLNEALEIWEAGQKRSAEHLLRGIIDKCPEHIDALHHLALIMEDKGMNLEAYLMEKEATDVGLQALHGKFVFEKDKLEWGWLENRPFLRAYHGLALIYQRQGRSRKALRIYEDILAINPNDNQGVRCLAIECYFKLKQPKNVIALCEKYERDVLPDILYGKPLALIQIGSMKSAKTSLEKAVSDLPLIAAELLKKRHVEPKQSYPGSISHGGADQAYEYWHRSGDSWSKTPEAMKVLAELIACGR